MRRFWLIVLFLAAAACADGTTSPTVTDEVADLPADQIMYDLRHTMTTNGIRRAVLRSDTAYLHQHSGRVDLIGVDVTFYDENGRQSGTLTSQTGDYDWRSGAMVARGDAVLLTEGAQGRRRLETEVLHLDLNADRLWSTTAVVMHEGGRVIRGTGFEADSRFQNVTVTRAQAAEAPGRGGGISF